jgi:hypothetical protein
MMIDNWQRSVNWQPRVARRHSWLPVLGAKLVGLLVVGRGADLRR